jgi:hypothetical protein
MSMTETTGPAYEKTRDALAEIFHENFCNAELAPHWQITSIKYKTAVRAGIDAVLRHMQGSKKKT